MKAEDLWIDENISFQLEFIRDEDGGPQARIRVGGISGDAHGHRYITPDCVTYTELSCQADHLIKELQRVLRVADRHFEPDRSKLPVSQLSWMMDRITRAVCQEFRTQPSDAEEKLRAELLTEIHRIFKRQSVARPETNLDER